MQFLSQEEGALAVTYARKTLNEHLCNEKSDPITLPASFQEKKGVFVTLTKAGILRGCIGFPLPIMPLGAAIRDAALSAAQTDPRFPPVRCDELSHIRIDITVLTVPQLCTAPAPERPSSITVGTHGLIIRGHGRSGLLLPQVPVEWGWDAVAFLNQTCIKAGLSPASWTDPSVELLTFEGQIFTE